MLFLRDIRHALRSLARNPGFTLAACVALCVAIGANTAVFSVVSAMLNFPMPVHDPDRVAFLFSENPEQNIQQGSLSTEDFLEFRARLRGFVHLTASTGRQYNLVGSGDPQRVAGTQVTPGFFALAGVDLHQGRGFLPEEGQEGRQRVAILSHAFVQRTFGGNPEILEQTLRLDGEIYQVVGVAPEGFFFGNPSNDLWTPLVLESGTSPRDRRHLFVAGRLRPGWSAAQVSAEAADVALDLENQWPQTNRGWTARVITVPDNYRQGVAFANTLLYASITFVLLIACVNVANLILARSLAREREFAMRASLGASRGQLVLQLLVESVVLALVGGTGGFLLGLGGIEVLRNWLAPDPNVGFLASLLRGDRWVLLHTVGISTLAGILFGLYPAFQATRGQLTTLMNEGGRSGYSRRRRHLRNGLVMAEVALALALLVTSGTLIRAFHRIYNADPGLDPNHLLTFQISLPERDYPESAQVTDFFRRAQERLEALPGSRSALTTTLLPLTVFPGPGTAHATIEGRGDNEEGQSPNIIDLAVSPGYFETLAIVLQQGRTFGPADREGREPVAVVTESFVETFLAGEEAVGRRLRLKRPAQEDPGPWRQIVGVVANHDIHAHSLRRRTVLPAVFVPFDQNPSHLANLAVRTTGPPLELAAAARAAVWQVDPELPIDDLQSLDQVVQRLDTQNRFFLRILGGLSITALLLAAVGIYGIIAYSVNQRTREIGIRTAFGALPAHAVTLVVRQAVTLTSLGILVGCVLAWQSVRFLDSQLEGVAQTQAGGPSTFLLVIGVFLVVTLLASAVPSLRAARLDPVRALRED